MTAMDLDRVRDTVIARIRLPQGLLDQYERLAELEHISLDQYVVLTLQRGIEQNYAQMSYPITSADDKEIRRLLGGRIDSPAKLIDMIQRLVTFHIGGWRAELRPAVMEQIYWSLKSMGKEGDPKAAEELIVSAIAEKFRV